MDAAIAWWPAILWPEQALFPLLTKLNLMSWGACKIVAEKLSLRCFKRPFRWKRMLPNGIPFGGLALCKTKCFTRTRVPEYYA
jgi:hypothetical protein